MLLWLGLIAASACATEVNTLDEEAGTAGTPEQPTAGASGSGDSSSIGGKPATAGAPGTSGGANVAGTGGAGGKPSGAFGGTSSSGGDGSGGTATGGTAGAGGKGGSGGSAGTGGSAGSGGKGGSGGSAGAGGSGTASCLTDWKSDPCDTCTTQTQGDKLACVEILDCYATNACGPTSCASNDDKCGVNKIAKGTAGYPIAAEVYNCLCK